MAGLAGVEDLFAARALDKAAEFFGLPSPRRGPLGRRCGGGEGAPANQCGHNHCSGEEPPWPVQDAYTEIRCMELFM